MCSVRGPVRGELLGSAKPKPLSAPRAIPILSEGKFSSSGMMALESGAAATLHLAPFDRSHLILDGPLVNDEDSGNRLERVLRRRPGEGANPLARQIHERF